MTPMIQALHALLFTPGDDTQVMMLYGVGEFRGILMRKEFDSWAHSFPDRFRVMYGSAQYRYSMVYST